MINRVGSSSVDGVMHDRFVIVVITALFTH